MIVPRYYENLNVLHENTMPARAYYIPASKRMDNLVEHREESDRMQLLNGTWKFQYFTSIYNIKDSFFEKNYDTENFDEYVVAAPGQLETYLAAYAPASAGDERIFRRFGHACCLRKFSMAAISRYLGVSSMNLGTMRRMSSYSCRVWADSSAAHSR